MFDKVWKNLHVATMQDKDGLGIINNAAIAMKDGRVVWVGRENDVTQDKNADVIDGEGLWALPAFIDCHTHLIYAGNRAAEFEQRLQGVSYSEIAKSGGGILSTVAATRAASEDTLYDLTLARLRPLFRESVATIEIKSGYGLDLATERKMLRVATRLRDDLGLDIQRTFLGAHALPPEYTGQADAYINMLCHEILPVLHTEKLVDTVDAFCESIGFSTAQVSRLFDAAKKLGLPVKLHAEQLSNQKGASCAATFGALSADHLEYIDEESVKSMAAADMTAVLLPAAFYYLREKQLPPVDLFRHHKVAMAIATDHNPGTSPVTSLVLMLNMACTLFRLTPEETLKGVTRHAAKAMGRSQDIGQIAPGYNASFGLWAIDHPRDLCYAIGGNPCRGLVLKGEYYNFADE